MQDASWFPSALSGWRLFSLLVIMQLAMVVAIAIDGTDVDGMRNIVLSTTCYAFFPFCLIFSASALQTLWPSESSRWLLRNRRFIGLAFAVEQTVHIATVIIFALRAPAVYANESTFFSQFLGVVAYLFALGMAATSFGAMKARLGPVLWKLLHRSGMYSIWIAYAWIFGKRLIKHPSVPLYIVAMSLLVLCLVLRALAHRVAAKEPAHALR